MSDLEAENEIKGHLKYVLYEDTGGSWRVQAVAAEGFTSRKALPSPWRGVRDSDLSKIAGIDGCIFCHNSGVFKLMNVCSYTWRVHILYAGFIGGNKTRQGVVAMAQAALAFSEPAADQ